MFVINNSLGGAGKMDAASLWPLTAAAAAASALRRRPTSTRCQSSRVLRPLPGLSEAHWWKWALNKLESPGLLPACGQIWNFHNNINQSPIFNFLLDKCWKIRQFDSIKHRFVWGAELCHPHCCVGCYGNRSEWRLTTWYTTVSRCSGDVVLLRAALQCWLTPCWDLQHQ